MSPLCRLVLEVIMPHGPRATADDPYRDHAAGETEGCEGNAEPLRRFVG